LQQKGLLHEAIDIVRLVDSAPPSLRPTLCEAVTNNEFRANWYADDSDVASALEASPRASRHLVLWHVGVALCPPTLSE
jgi:hypothetical protein